MTDQAFDIEHFHLLNSWKGEVRDKNDAQHEHVYERLKAAYGLTKQWAERVQKRLFPQGKTRVVQRPTHQWTERFLSYNWARIYPTKDAPAGLAYTVGMEAGHGFVVKIDVVNKAVSDPSLRGRYEEMRGEFTASGIVKVMPTEQGVQLGLDGLVDWAVQAIQSFTPTYDQLVERLGFANGQDDRSLLAKFRGHQDFEARQPKWSAQTTALFLRMASALHEAGLDWWYTRATNSQLRFGRKELGAGKGTPVGSFYLQHEGIRVRQVLTSPGGEAETAMISDDLLQRIEAVIDGDGGWQERLGNRPDRPGHWPVDYLANGDAGEAAEELDEPDEPDVGALERASNTIFYGPPGTGKTRALQEWIKTHFTGESGARHAFVTFHQSYGYEEFVEGLRPVLANDAARIAAGANGEEKAEAIEATEATEAKGDVQYEIRRGIFWNLCDQARQDPGQRYAMVIDEINRGNISKIFGELITLIEADKREGAPYEAKVTLPYSQQSFTIPPNVDLIGSMNTADRSLALVDTALRRRFEFIEYMPDPSLLTGIRVSSHGIDIDLEAMLGTINQRIEALYDRDHTIGHAYLMPLKTLPEGADAFQQLAAIFRRKILPLLEEYFFEDWQKIRLVLGDNQKATPQHQFIQEISQEADLVSLFGARHGLDQYATRTRYRLNPSAFDNPQAYLGIYQARAEPAGSDQ